MNGVRSGRWQLVVDVSPDMRIGLTIFDAVRLARVVFNGPPKAPGVCLELDRAGLDRLADIIDRARHRLDTPPEPEGAHHDNRMT